MKPCVKILQKICAKQRTSEDRQTFENICVMENYNCENRLRQYEVVFFLFFSMLSLSLSLSLYYYEKKYLNRKSVMVIAQRLQMTTMDQHLFVQMHHQLNHHQQLIQ
jgi:hypothetical protein